jgi:hypothetical protein
MDWMKQIPDEELLDVASGILAGCASALHEYRAAKLAWKANNEAAHVRLEEARKWLRERLDNYEAMAAEVKVRGLK